MAAKETILSELIYGDHDDVLLGLYSYCAVSKLLLGCFLGTLISLFFFFFFFFWKCWFEIWLSYLPLHHHTSSQVDKTSLSFAVFPPITSHLPPAVVLL